MNLGEIFGHIPKLFKGQIKSYLGLIALGIVSALALSSIFILLLILFTMSLVNGNLSLGHNFNFGPLYSLFQILFFLQFIPLYFAINAGFIKMASEQILGRKISCMEAYRFGFRKIWCLFFGGILYSIITIIGLILLIIPGLYFGNACSLFLHSIVIEDKGPWSALKRSKALTKGSWCCCLGVMLLMGILIIFIKFALDNLYFLTINLTTATSIVTHIIAIVSISILLLLNTFTMIATTLLYYDLMKRNGNLDSQVMVDNLTEKTI